MDVVAKVEPDDLSVRMVRSLVHDLSELLLNRQVAQPANDWALVAMVDAVLWNLRV